MPYLGTQINTHIQYSHFAKAGNVKTSHIKERSVFYFEIQIYRISILYVLIYNI
jgi:hypothetical protein